MTIAPNYSLNIARLHNNNQYYHFCDVELGCIGEETSWKRYNEFCKRFPKEEGWLIELTYVDCSVKTIARTC